MSFPPDDPIPDYESFPDDASAEREGKGGILPEFVRKAAVAGLGALFMTEEGVRGLAGQMKLPKEVLGFLLSQAEKTKDEVGRVISEEVRRFLQSEKLKDELLRLMAGMTIEVKAQVRLVPAKKQDGHEAEKADAAPAVAITEVTARRTRRHKKE